MTFNEFQEQEIIRLTRELYETQQLLQALLNDTQPVHLTRCNYSTYIIGEHFCNCPLGKRIYNYKKALKKNGLDKPV